MDEKDSKRFATAPDWERELAKEALKVQNYVKAMGAGLAILALATKPEKELRELAGPEAQSEAAQVPVNDVAMVPAGVDDRGRRSKREAVPAIPKVGEAPANSQGWTLATPRRFPGYRKQLFDFLKAAHSAGNIRPKARDVLDVWTKARPSNVTEVMHDGLKYLNCKGDTNTADLKAIEQAIKALTT